MNSMTDVNLLKRGVTQPVEGENDSNERIGDLFGQMHNLVGVYFDDFCF